MSGDMSQLTGMDLMNGMSRIWNQGNFRKIFASLLSAIAFANVGCSTPQIPYVDPNPPDTAWYAYQQCLSEHPGAAYARSSPCDHAGDQNRQSQYYYTTTADTRSIGYDPEYYNGGTCVGCVSYTGSPETNYWARGYRSSARGNAPESAESSEGYRAFLQTLDDESLRALTAEWQALAKSK